MATLLGSLLVSLGLDSGQFKSGLAQSEKELRAATKRIEKIGQNMADLGGRLSVAVSAPLVALGVTSVKAAMESQDAIAQVNQALLTMGNAAGRTSEQLKKLADGQMRKSLYDDDEILRSVTANLLTFGNIAGKQFDMAQQAALDLSARLGQDLQSSAIQVGKALNDPIKGITALQRVGVSFTEQQREQIKAMTEAGDVAGAQALVLAELQKQFGGAAEAARNADPFAAMRQSWAEFQEQVGGQLLKAMPAITAAIVSVLEAFNSLSPGMQKVVVVGGVLLAALGPVLIALGGLVSLGAPLIAAFGGIAGIVAGVSTAFTLLTTVATVAGRALLALVATNPVLAAVAAAATAVYLAWKNWDKIKEIAGRVGSSISSWWSGTVSPVLTKAWGLVKQGAQVWWNLHLGVAKAMAGLYTSVKTWLQDKLGAVFKWVADKVKWVGDQFYKLYDRVVGHSYVPDMVDGIAAEMARLDAVMAQPAAKATSKTAAAFQAMADKVRPLLDRLFPQIAALNAFRADNALIDSAAKAGPGGGGVSPELAEQMKLALALQSVGADIADPLVAISDALEADKPLIDFQAIADGIAAISGQARGGIAGAIDSMKQNLVEFGLTSRDVFMSVADNLKGVLMGAQSVGDALRNLVSQLASKALDGLFNMVGMSMGIPGFASGTNFAPGGLALVGERGPELVNLPRGSEVIPNHELGGLGMRREVHSPTFVFPGVTNERMAREAAGQAARRYRADMNGPLRRMS